MNLSGGANNVGSAEINDGSIVNDDINANADIAETKINNRVTSVRNIPMGSRSLVAPTPMGVATNTSLSLGRIFIARKITACTKFSIEVTTVSVAGTCNIALFSEDGQTKIFEFTTPSISTTGLKTFTITSVDVPIGVYYIGIVPVDTTNIAILGWTTTNSAIDSITGEPDYQGVLTVTAGTIPATVDITALTPNTTSCMLFQLDK